MEDVKLKIWWLANEEADSARLRPHAPQYLKEQLMSRRGRNGRGRLWIAKEFGSLYLPRFDSIRGSGAFLPGGIVIWPSDERFCVGGHVSDEVLRPEPIPSPN